MILSNIKTSLCILFLLLIFSCAPPRQFNELRIENDDCQKEREMLKSKNEKLSVENTELLSKIEVLDKNRSKWSKDSIRRIEEYNQIRRDFENLNTRYYDLKKTQESLIEGSSSETRKLLQQLQATQDDLYKKEDELNKFSHKIDKDKKDLQGLKMELESRNRRLVELENVLTRKDSAVNALKKKVSTALLGFEGQGLSVTQKNGKVYVSLEEKLLFQSGSTQVDAKGVNALKKLATVLEQNPDINIMIEGHTDDVPVIQGSRFKDNWDLSVQRATSIVRILLDNTTIKPDRLTASGRGEFMPVDARQTPEARQKNRRTEIILTPKLDELFQILDSN
ncbi:MAG: OmpA family protein [Bacteroidales bacterium]|nr:OmpA family protein [Bacteroidales bacterium]